MDSDSFKDSNNVKILINEISSKYNECSKNTDLQKLRDENHKLYYNMDVDFLNNVDVKYQEDALEIINRYNNINSKSILTQNKIESNNTNILLHQLGNEIDNLKEKIKSDLNTVINYVDRLSSKIDISSITRETPLGILILNKYDAFIVYSADLKLSDVNSAMKRQSKRLMYLKELDYLINNYNSIKCKYNSENTNIFINNLYEIVGKYLYLLTNTEFEYTKEAIKKILAYKFDFIDKYLPTYKIILVKIWTSKLTSDFYFICDLDLDKDNIYLMNELNIDSYNSSGYICDIPKSFINYFNIEDMDVINFPLPSNLVNKYEIKTNNFDRSKVNLKAIYTTRDNALFKSILPIVYINKNKNM